MRLFLKNSLKKILWVFAPFKDSHASSPRNVPTKTSTGSAHESAQSSGRGPFSSVLFVGPGKPLLPPRSLMALRLKHVGLPRDSPLVQLGAGTLWNPPCLSMWTCEEPCLIKSLVLNLSSGVTPANQTKERPVH